MKSIFYALFIFGFAAALSACGGGGGGGGRTSPPETPKPPSPANSATVTMTPPVITEEERSVAQRQADILQASFDVAAENLAASSDELDALQERIDELEAAIADAERTLESLQREIDELEADLVAIAELEFLVTLNPPDGLDYRTPEFNRNYGLGRINADFAYQRGYFGQGVTVGVMDSGVLTSHFGLRDNIVAGYDFIFRTSVIDDPHPNGHGTFVAGIVGATKDDRGLHGVAPSVSIMPLQIGDRDGIQGQHQITAANFAIDNGAKIINASFGSFGMAHGDLVAGGQKHWFISPVPEDIYDDDSFFPTVANRWADAVRDEDVVVVWAAGNEGFNTENGSVEAIVANCDNPDDDACFGNTVFFDISDVDENFLPTDDDFLPLGDYNTAQSTIPFWIVDEFRASVLAYYEGIYYDNVEEVLESDFLEFIDSASSNPDFVHTAARWLAVVATDENDRIWRRSNGCGIAKDWCIAAPGVTVSSTAGSANNRLRSGSGTSYSAPHVSGALALLQSAAPVLPMTAIRQILLTTATDLGERGVDDLYGWGLVNLDAGIQYIGTLRTADGKVLLSDMRRGLPGEFSHLRGRLDSVSVAIRITDDSYYNMPLSDIVKGGGGGEKPQTKIGVAAKEMQADKYVAGESFRFSGGLDYADGESGFIGVGDSPFAAANAEDVGGHIRWTTADYGGMSGFGEYGRTQIKANYGADSLISAVRNARAESWTAGIQSVDIWRHGDRLRFSARQESRISGGEAVINYLVADGDSHLAFIGEGVQTIRTETAYIPLKQTPETIWTAGYSRESDGGKWSAAAEWNAATNAKGFSFAAEWKF